MEATASAIVTRCKELKTYWSARDTKMRQWYRLIQMVDELKTEKMESFVGNDARALFNLSLHILNVKIPYRLKNINTEDPNLSEANEQVGRLMDLAWDDIQSTYRHSGPRNDIHRTILGFMLSTGWYAVFAPTFDDGSRMYCEPWNPIEVYPMWDIEFGLSEVAHVYKTSARVINKLSAQRGWNYNTRTDQDIYDYWWVGESLTFFGLPIIYNAIVIGNMLVKFEATRFRKIPVYVSPVGGLPDTGSLSEGADMSSNSYNAAGKGNGERWKEEVGQAIIATNENIYRTWNKWWTFSLQLLRDTAQPRVFERSRSGKAIVKPEEVFRRGVVWRGGPDDSVEFITPPNMPIELRSNQLDLEAMMQRGGVSWSMYGSQTGGMSAYVMSQISASANQVMGPFHSGRQALYEDIANDWLNEVIVEGIRPYSWKRPDGLTEDSKIDASFPIEIPGDLVQRLTSARMADPDFRVSYTYVMNKLFPDIKDPARERARVLSDMAVLNPVNSLIAQVQYYRQQADFLSAQGDFSNAELYTLAAEAAMAQLKGPQQAQPAAVNPIGGRTEGAPPSQTNGTSFALQKYESTVAGKNLPTP